MAMRICFNLNVCVMHSQFKYNINKSGRYAVLPTNFPSLLEWMIFSVSISYQDAYSDSYLKYFLEEFIQFTDEFRTVCVSAKCFSLDTWSHSVARFSPFFCRIFAVFTVVLLLLFFKNMCLNHPTLYAKNEGFHPQSPKYRITEAPNRFFESWNCSQGPNHWVSEA